jgi:hypothetical protein
MTAPTKPIPITPLAQPGWPQHGQTANMLMSPDIPSHQPKKRADAPHHLNRRG